MIKTRRYIPIIASAARDYERIQFLADSLGKAGKLSKGESNICASTLKIQQKNNLKLIICK